MYFGPEALMPLASVLAGVTGAVLLFWRRVVGAWRWVRSRVGWSRRTRPPDDHAAG